MANNGYQLRLNPDQFFSLRWENLNLFVIVITLLMNE